MFTLEIAGKAVAITNANEEQAKDLFMSDEFKEDLKTFTSEGRPIWDGTAVLNIRRASDDEIDAFDDALEDDEDLEDEDEDEPGIDVMFLVEVDDEDEDEA